MNWTNRIIALGLVATAATLLPYTDKFPGAAADFPRLVLWVIIALAALMMARTFLAKLAPVTTAEGEQSLSRMIRPLCAFAATVVAVLIMRFIGFYPAVALLGFALMGILGAERPLVFGITMLGLLVFVYVLFQLLLGVPLGQTRLWAG